MRKKNSELKARLEAYVIEYANQYQVAPSLEKICNELELSGRTIALLYIRQLVAEGKLVKSEDESRYFLVKGE